MAKLRRPHKSARSDGAPSAIRLDLVTDPTPAAIAALTDEEQRIVWRELRRHLFSAECGHPRFDPRRRLGLSSRERARWFSARRRWLREEIFRGDHRVVDMIFGGTHDD